MFGELLYRLGKGIHRHRLKVLGIWLVVILLASLGASRVERVLLGGSGSIPNSQSALVDATLYRDFRNPFTKLVLVTFKGDTLTVDAPSYRALVAKAARILKGSPHVQGVMSYYETKDPKMKSPDEKATALLVGLNARDVKDEEHLLPSIRRLLDSLQAEGKGMGIAVNSTGRAALMYDLNAFNAQDSAKAEGRALPLTLLILVLVFGSLAAAGLPLLMGMTSTTVTLGLVFLLGHCLELSLLTQNIATMLGLAVGIDYSLLMVSRFREELKEDEGDVGGAIARTLATSGQAVIYSGLTVMIGLCGLFFTPIFETQSVGLGGVLVVCLSVLAATTLVPALLSLLGRHVDWPVQFSRRLQSEKGPEAWRRWAHAVMRRPFIALCAALLLAGGLAYPASHSRFGFPDQKWFPQALEARKGLDVLASMNQGWGIMPIFVVVSGSEEITSPASLGKLMRLSRTLQQNPLVNQVYSPVDLKEGVSPLAYLLLYSNLENALERYPQIGELFLSRDRRAALFQVTLKNQTTLKEAQAFVRRLPQTDLAPLKLHVGGQLVFYNDYDETMNRCFPWVIGFVLLATFLVLSIAYRSLLIPIKAILMNLLSVGAGYGALVAVFVLGWGRQLVGLPDVIAGIPQSIPLIIFCVVFGLSMDYEVFMLSRISEGYRIHRDNQKATAEGLAATGGIITSAALIMVVVFGAFAWAEMVIIKMLGFGLAVAVLVDATIIRCLAIPAFMRIAGKWNWFPGEKP